MSEKDRIIAAAEAWLAARTEAIRLLANGEPASGALSALGAAEHALADAVRGYQHAQVVAGLGLC